MTWLKRFIPCTSQCFLTFWLEYMSAENKWGLIYLERLIWALNRSICPQMLFRCKLCLTTSHYPKSTVTTPIHVSWTKLWCKLVINLHMYICVKTVCITISLCLYSTLLLVCLRQIRKVKWPWILTKCKSRLSLFHFEVDFVTLKTKNEWISKFSML